MISKSINMSEDEWRRVVATVKAEELKIRAEGVPEGEGEGEDLRGVDEPE